MQNFHSQSFNRENFLFQILRRNLTCSELTEATSEHSEVRTKMFYVVIHIGVEYFSREYKTFYETENKLLRKVLFRTFLKARFTDAQTSRCVIKSFWLNCSFSFLSLFLEYNSRFVFNRINLKKTSYTEIALALK